MYSSKGVEVKENNRISPVIEVGVHRLKINGIDIQKASSTDSKKLVFNMETAPVDDENFKPFDGMKGQAGRVSTVFAKTEKQEKELFERIILLADKINVRDEVDKIEGEDFWNWMMKINDSKILNNKYAWFRITGQEYKLSDKPYPGVALQFSRYGWVAADDTGGETLKPIDKNKSYDYKRLDPSEDEQDEDESHTSQFTSG